MIMLELTNREYEITSWIAEGLTNTQIGRRAGTSPLTVKNQVSKILNKTQAMNRAQLVAWFIREGAHAHNKRSGRVDRDEAPPSPLTGGAIEYDSWGRFLQDNKTYCVKLQGPGEEEYVSWYFLKGGGFIEPYCWYDETDDRAIFNPDEVSDIPQEHEIIPLYK
jgi:DNA-binding CsgD family transcriptional regulator